MSGFPDAVWIKSTRSTPDGEDCVEVALRYQRGAVPVRDSKHPGGDVLVVSSAGWRCFTDALKAQ